MDPMMQQGEFGGIPVYNRFCISGAAKVDVLALYLLYCQLSPSIRGNYSAPFCDSRREWSGVTRTNSTCDTQSFFAIKAAPFRKKELSVEMSHVMFLSLVRFYWNERNVLYFLLPN